MSSISLISDTLTYSTYGQVSNLLISQSISEQTTYKKVAGCLQEKENKTRVKG